MSYLAVKHLHVSCVVLSLSLFLLRGMLQLAGKPWRQHRWLRILPHANDTVLLGAALWMVSQWPADAPHGWIYAKLLALAAYILIARKALSTEISVQAQRASFALALGCAAYIVGVALTRSPALKLLG